MAENTTAKKPAAKKTAAKKTAAKKPAAKKTAAKKPAAKKAAPKVETPEVVAEGVDLQARVAELREQLEDRVADIREAIEGVVEELRALSIDNIRALDRETLGEYVETVQEALNASGDATVAGLRDVNTELLNIFEANVAEGFKNARALVAAETVRDAVEIQREFVKAQVEAYRGQAEKVVNLSNERAEAARKPVAAALQANWEKFKNVA
ncbi:MAG: phasin family protein [Alphaproteobacteria bacterium]